jgi:hypothetical protein
MNELNLITPEEKFEQNTSSIFKILNVVFVALVLAVGGFSYYSYQKHRELKSEKDTLMNQVDLLKKDLSGFNSEELLLRNISIKYNTYSAMKKTNIQYGEIIREIYSRSAGLSLNVKEIIFTQDKNEVSIKVVTEADQFTRFVSNMKSQDFKDSKYPKLFSPSDRNEEVNQATKEYIVYVKYDSSQLK